MSYICLDEAIRKCVPMDFDSKMAISERELMRIPTADVHEAKYGKWLNKIESSGCVISDVCSECGKRRVRDNYCSNCGTDMRRWRA